MQRSYDLLAREIEIGADAGHNKKMIISSL